MNINRSQYSSITEENYSCEECEGYIKVSFFDLLDVKLGKGKINMENCEIKKYRVDMYPEDYYTTHYDLATCEFTIENVLFDMIMKQAREIIDIILIKKNFMPLSVLKN